MDRSNQCYRRCIVLVQYDKGRLSACRGCGGGVDGQ